MKLPHLSGSHLPVCGISSSHISPQSFLYAAKVGNSENSLLLPAQPSSLTEGSDAFALCHLSVSGPQTPLSESAWFFTDFIKINKGLAVFRSY